MTAVEALREKQCRWAQAQEQLARTAELLELDDGTHRMLANPRRSVEVSLPIRSDEGDVVVFEGYRVLHSSTRGPGKGGLRYDPAASLAETKALAMWMTWKCALLDPPAGTRDWRVLHAHRARGLYS